MDHGASSSFDVLRQAQAVERYDAGDVIFARDDPAGCLYIVRSGQVNIRVGETIVERIGRGGMFGELAMIEDEPRSASAVAETDCELVAIDRAEFLDLVRASPVFGLNVMRAMADRLRRATP